MAVQRNTFEFQKIARAPDVGPPPQSAIAAIAEHSEINLRSLAQRWLDSHEFSDLMIRAQREPVDDAVFIDVLARMPPLEGRIDGELVAAKLCRELTRAWSDTLTVAPPPVAPVPLQPTGRSFRDSYTRGPAEPNTSVKSVLVTVVGVLSLLSGVVAIAGMAALIFFGIGLEGVPQHELEALGSALTVIFLIGIGFAAFYTISAWGLVFRNRAARGAYLTFTILSTLASAVTLLGGSWLGMLNVAWNLAVIYLLIQPEIVDEFH